MLKIADWRGKVCSLIFFVFLHFDDLCLCLSFDRLFSDFLSFWWRVSLDRLFRVFSFILMMCVNPWCWAGPVRRSWIIYQKFIFTIPRLSFSTYISTFSFFKSQIRVNIMIWISTMQCCSSAPCKKCHNIKSQRVTQFWQEIDRWQILTGFKHIE